MASKKISELSPAAALVGSEVLSGVQGGNTVSITPADIATFLGAWTTWTPTFGGFSVAPVVVAKSCKIGKLVFCYCAVTTQGTSNATTFTITLPYASATGNQAGKCAYVSDNGSFSGDGMILTAASATATIYKTANFGAWTGSGNKSAAFILVYESI